MTTTEILIVNWNNRRETLECVAAVEAQITEGATITVIDNGSTDGSATAITSKHPNVKLFALSENRGFTGGLAAALAGSTATNVVFLNNDAVPEPGWLDALVRAIENAPADVVSVGGKIVDPTGTKIDFIGRAMTFDGHAFQNGFRYPVGSRKEPDAGDELLFACGGNMISRRERLAELGAFDDDYFAYLEDVDFGWRTWISGRRATIEPRAVVRHASSSTSNRLGDFALDPEHVCQIASISLRPEMRVVSGIDQLRIDSYLVRDPLDASFQNVSYPERTADVMQIPHRRALILRHTGAADHFQVCDLGQIRENFILNTVGKERVLFVVAEIFKWKDRDAFVRDGRRRSLVGTSG